MLTEAMLTDMGWTPALIAQRVRCLTVEDVLTGFRSCAGEEFWTADSVERAFRSDARAPGEALRGMMLAARAAALGGAGYVLHGLDYGDGEGPVKGRMVVPAPSPSGRATTSWPPGRWSWKG
jgi:hypothetical protein